LPKSKSQFQHVGRGGSDFTLAHLAVAPRNRDAAMGGCLSFSRLSKNL
jgi:hypothetical protein